jgi:hypothetical protein
MAQSEYNGSDWNQFSNNDINSNLFLRICENGNSGSIEIKNSTKKDVKLTSTVDFNNGESATGTAIIELNDKTPKIVCFNSMETKGGGIKPWRFKNIIVRDSNGFDAK